MPRNVDELVEVFQAHPQAKLLAGGTDFMVEVNLHGRKPDTMISLRQVKELSEWSVRTSQARITIGAGVPYAEMEVGDSRQWNDDRQLAAIQERHDDRTPEQQMLLIAHQPVKKLFSLTMLRRCEHE